MSNFFMRLLQIILATSTPAIIESLREMVAEFKKKAAATPNPVDDILAGFLEALVGKPGD
jgi:hypothetical protein